MPAPTEFHQLLDAAPDAMLVVDRYGMVAALNLAAEQFFGWTEQELLGEPMSRLIPTRFHPLLGSDFEAGGGETVSCFARRHDGSEFPVELVRRLIGQGSDARSLITLRDLTHWRRARETRSRNNEQARATLEAIGDAVITTDAFGRITFRVQVFPRTPERADDLLPRGHERLSTGIAGLDEMMGGGIPAGDSLVLAGPTGTGKTTFAMKFVAAGLAVGEAAVIAIFEEHPEVYLERAKSVGVDLRAAMREGKLSVIYLRPLDLSVDETLEEIRTAVERIGAKRVVIDSISGFEMALAPAFREDFRESLYRLIGALTGLGVTMFSTVEVVEGAGEGGLRLTGYQVSFLTDDILSQRYVEIEGELKKALVVVKMRGSLHSKEFRTYEITATGVQLRESLRDYDGIITRMPTRQLRIPPPPHPGLTEQEVLVLEMVSRAKSMSSAEVAKQTGLPSLGTGVILDRLAQLSYVSKKGTRYKAEARPGGF